MLQRMRTKEITPAMQANRLLDMRDNLKEKLGAEYARLTEPFKPFVAIQLKKSGCPQRAAARVCQLLKSQGADLAAQRLVMCCALDLALPQ